MKTADFDYELPRELIAQHPAERRDASRLLVYERASGAVRHRVFADLPDELRGELVVVNDTRVLPARIPIERPRGEVLLLERAGDGLWEGLARPTRRLRAGTRYGDVELLEHLGEVEAARLVMAALEKVVLDGKTLTKDLGEQLKLEGATEGVVVVNVADGSAAQQKGLQRGDVITEVDRAAVHSAEDFKAAIDKIDPAKGVLLYVQRGGTSTFVVLKDSK